MTVTLAARTVASMTKPTAVIVDVDGTLVDVSPVRHYLHDGKRDFESFHRASVFCDVIASTRQAILAAHDAGHAVFVVTARKAKYRHLTGRHLAESGVVFDDLLTRGDYDERSDVEVKRELLALIRTTHDVAHAWDDNPHVVALWESEGIAVTVVPGWAARDTDVYASSRA